MKKWFIGIGIVLIVLIACIYIFIPGNLGITQVTPVKAAANGVYRVLADTSKWRNWWPSAPTSHNGYRFTIQQRFPHALVLSVEQEDVSMQSRIVIMPVQRDSVSLVWQSEYASGNNPFKRISSYGKAVELKNTFAEILLKFKAYVENTANVYGYKIQQTSTTDTLLMAARATTTAPPSVQEVYKLVGQLKNYINTNGAQQTGYPMLNITPTANEYQFQVAVPVNKILPDKGIIFSRRMVPGNFMMLEAQGGLKAIDHAMRQIQQYAADYQRTSMAIPFQVMITDRLKEQDTARWITRIYYPVM
jgi:hypothetical protein